MFLAAVQLYVLSECSEKKLHLLLAIENELQKEKLLYLKL